MEERKITLNKSFLYVFPVIYREIIIDLQADYELFNNNGMMPSLANSYCYVEDNEQFAISFTYTDMSQTILEIFSKCKYFITHHTDEENINIIFSIPEGAGDCYNKFVAGKYSKFSDNDKKTIVEFLKKFIVFKSADKSQGPNQSESLLQRVIQILNKSPERAKELREMFGLKESEWNPEWEVNSIIDKNKENLKIL